MFSKLLVASHLLLNHKYIVLDHTLQRVIIIINGNKWQISVCSECSKIFFPNMFGGQMCVCAVCQLSAGLTMSQGSKCLKDSTVRRGV